MAIVPSRLFQWATSVLGLSRRTPPTTGLADDGYPLNAVPSSGNLNDILGNIGEWLDYVYQSFSVSAEFEGAVTVNDAAQLNAGLEVNNGNLVLGASPPVEIIHDYFKTQVVCAPFVFTAAFYDMPGEILISTSAGRSKWGFVIDGGMRVRQVSALARCISGSVNVDVTAALTDATAGRLTKSNNATLTGGAWTWIDVNLVGEAGWPVPIPRAGANSLMADVTYAGGNVQIAKVVMFYDRPA